MGRRRKARELLVQAIYAAFITEDGKTRSLS